MKTYNLVTREDDTVLATFTASEVDAEIILDQFAHRNDYEEEFELEEITPARSDMERFGRFVYNLMEEQPEWNSDTFEDIASYAANVLRRPFSEPLED